MLKTIILDISTINEGDDLSVFRKNTGYHIVRGIETFIRHHGTDEPYDFSAACHSSFLITDCVMSMEIAKENAIGCCAYIHADDMSKYPDVLYCIEWLKNLSDNFILRMYQRANDIPWKIFETQRCIVREITVKDVERLYEIYADKETKMYTEDLYPEKELEISYIEDYIKNQYRYSEYGMWVVILKETETLIGRAGIFNRIGQTFPEIGFIFDKNYWGRGIATEVLKGVLDYAKDELSMDCLVAHVMPSNRRSINLLKKLGFEYVTNATFENIEYEKYLISM